MGNRFVSITFLFFLSCNDNSDIAKGSKVVESTKNQVDTTFKPIIISDSTNILDGKTQTLDLQYIVWGCACANWITTRDYIKYQDTGKLSEHCIFIEPADSTQYLPERDSSLIYRIQVTGQFYIRKDYPKGYFKTEEEVEKAPVFRYTKHKVITIKKIL